MKPVSIALPLTSSFDGPVTQLFEKAGISIERKEKRDFRVKITDKRISDVQVLRPEEIPNYVAKGFYDGGLTGLDMEKSCKLAVKIIGEIAASRNSDHSVRLVIAAPEDDSAVSAKEMKTNATLVVERLYLRVAKKFLRKIGRPDIRILISLGCSEAKVPALGDYVFEICDSGKTLALNHLRIIETVMTSPLVVIANEISWNDPQKRQTLESLVKSLLGD